MLSKIPHTPAAFGGNASDDACVCVLVLTPSGHMRVSVRGAEVTVSLEQQRNDL